VSATKRITKRLRRATGIVWLAAWALLLYAVVSPWGELGGLVDERLRWLERFVLGAALLLGGFVGSCARQACRPGTGRTHAMLLRPLLFPVLLAGALALIALRLAGLREAIGILVTGLLGYWAGFDAVLAGLPLWAGRPYRFNGPIEPDPAPVRQPAGREDARS